VSMIVLFIIATINSHMIYGFRFHKIDQIAINGSHHIQMPFRCYFANQEYERFYQLYWNTIVMIIYNVVPALIIIVGNIKIATAILFSGNRTDSRVHPDGNTINYNRRKSSAKLLCILGIFYVITTTPFCIYFVARWRTVQLSAESFAKWQLATAIVNMLLNCNFSFNFFFYFMSGTLFKKEWNRLVGKVCARFQNRQSSSN
jgi:hypothetical protein